MPLLVGHGLNCARGPFRQRVENTSTPGRRRRDADASVLHSASERGEAFLENATLRGGAGELRRAPIRGARCPEHLTRAKTDASPPRTHRVAARRGSAPTRGGIAACRNRRRGGSSDVGLLSEALNRSNEQRAPARRRERRSPLRSSLLLLRLRTGCQKGQSVCCDVNLGLSAAWNQSTNQMQPSRAGPEGIFMHCCRTQSFFAE